MDAVEAREQLQSIPTVTNSMTASCVDALISQSPPQFPGRIAYRPPGILEVSYFLRHRITIVLWHFASCSNYHVSESILYSMMLRIINDQDTGFSKIQILDDLAAQISLLAFIPSGNRTVLQDPDRRLTRMISRAGVQ